jgi:hypothetical protein
MNNRNVPGLIGGGLDGNATNSQEIGSTHTNSLAKEDQFIYI